MKRLLMNQNRGAVITMTKKTKSILKLIIILSIVLIIVFLLLDYFNILGIVGIEVERFNTDYLSLFIGNLIVISLFVATYFIVDSHGLKKEKNKYGTALIMLKNTYLNCQKNIAFFDKKENRERIAKKCDFDKPINEEPMFLYFQNQPFEYQDAILNFSLEGIISPDEYEMYLKIQSQYKNYISMAISLYDSYEVARLERNPLNDKLAIALACLEAKK